MLVSTIDKISMSFCSVNRYSKACGLKEVTFAIKKVVPILGLTDSIDFLYSSVSLLLLGLYLTGVLLLGMILLATLPLYDLLLAIGTTLGNKAGGKIPCLIKS